MGLHLCHQGLQLFAELLLLLLEILELGVDHAQLGAQFHQLAVEGLDLFLRGFFFGLVMAAKALQQRFGLVERMLGAAADRAGFAVAQLAAQFFDAGVARQALAIEQLAGEGECLFCRFQPGLGRCAFADQLLALLHGLLLPLTQGVELLAQFHLATVQARQFLDCALLLAVVLQHAAEQVDLFGQGLGLGLGFAEQQLEAVALGLQLGIGLAGLCLQAWQFFATLGQAAADQHHLLELREVGLPGIGQARQVLAVGQCGVDQGQLFQAALLVLFQLLQVLLAFGKVLLSLLAGRVLFRQVLVEAGEAVLGGKGLPQAGAFSLCCAWLCASASRALSCACSSSPIRVCSSVCWRTCSAISAASGVSWAARVNWRWN